MRSISYEEKILLACIDIGKQLTSTLVVDQILSQIMVKISELFDAENWSLLLKDESTGLLSFDIVVGIDKEIVEGITIQPGEGIAGVVGQYGIPRVVKNIQDDPQFNNKIDKATGFVTRSIICVPLNSHGRTLGVIELVNVKDIELFESKYMKYLLILADYAAIAIENSLLFAKVERLSITDEYTGLYNARYLHHTLDRLFEKIGKGLNEFAVIFLDIDDFKKVVDKCGHLVGSKVLEKIGQTIKSCLKDKDTLIKYGGDEYIIILQNQSRTESKRIVETVLSKIRSSTYLADEGLSIKVTASSGMALCPSDAKTKKDVLLLADQAMYQVKHSTKDGLCICNE